MVVCNTEGLCVYVALDVCSDRWVPANRDSWFVEILPSVLGLVNLSDTSGIEYSRLQH